MNEPGVGIQIGLLHLAGNVQQRRVGIQRFDHGTDRIAGPRARAGQGYAQTGETAVGIGHGDRARFATRRYETDVATLPYRIGNRQIMNRDDAVHRRHLVLFQSPGYRLANRYFIAHHLPSYCVRCRGYAPSFKANRSSGSPDGSAPGKGFSAAYRP
ncbi:hypothetical protein D3C80_1146100 [compost metagenome]